MHRVINYGSFLQAYATQEVINSLGHNYEIIDYFFPNSWHIERGAEAQKGIKPIISNYFYPISDNKCDIHGKV